MTTCSCLSGRKKIGYKYPVALYALVVFTVFTVKHFINNDQQIDISTGRHLLWAKDTVNCTSPAIHTFPNDFFTPEQREQGAVVLHAFLACYMFVLLAIVCDDYFVPSIKTLTQKLNISEDVAGATFMAAATSSPELFINVVGTFVTEGDLGVGTIVGSAVFNILAVPACCGLLAGRSVYVDWLPLTRDCVSYGGTVILLIFILRDGVVQWYEALVMVILYFIYIAGIYFNDTKKLCKGRKQFSELSDLENQPLLKQVKDEPSSSSQSTEKSCTSSLTFEELDEPTAEDDLFTIPRGPFSRCFFFLTWPIAFVLYITIPDCRRKKSMWPLTFIMCIIWIATTSYLVSWMITVIGDTLKIPDSVMGLTLLAAGMSVPEAASSVIVTNQGHGSMGISSSIGSNIFDILLCLGLPWLIKSAFLPTIDGVHIIQINSEGLGYNVILLLSTLLVIYFALLFNGFILDRKIGFITLVVYLLFLATSTMVEMNVFGIVNLPTCNS